MRCPTCGASGSRVIDTTAGSDRDEVRRRRRCTVCGQRFTTIERVRSGLPLVAKDAAPGMPARREAFDAEKLRRGIQVACAKRPVPPQAIDRLVAGIEAQLRAEGAEEVSSREIGAMVLAALGDLDEIAYLRYAIVFLELDDLLAVRGEIDRMLEQRQQLRSGG